MFDGQLLVGRILLCCVRRVSEIVTQREHVLPTIVDFALPITIVDFDLSITCLCWLAIDNTRSCIFDSVIMFVRTISVSLVRCVTAHGIFFAKATLRTGHSNSNGERQDTMHFRAYGHYA